MAAKFVNPSVQLKTKDYHAMAKEDSTIYLYNIEQYRHAAGLATWYWQTDGYLQWHARMPGAYPFSPVDAREDDVFFIYPSAELCSATPDIDWTLLAISQGISDQRWLQWLVTTAEQNKDADQLVVSIQSIIQKQQSPLNVNIDTLNQCQIKQLVYNSSGGIAEATLSLTEHKQMNRRLRIAHIVQHLQPGGIETMVVIMANSMKGTVASR